jgi:hypothetical protein
MLHNQEVQINELQQQLKAGADNIGADVQADLKADIMTDAPSHSLREDDDETSYSDEGVSTEKKSAANIDTETDSATATAEETSDKEEKR